MLGWLKENAEVVSALASLGMLVVWLTYLQLIFREYRQSRQPHIVLHQTQGLRSASHCLLVNMSQSVIHVQCILLVAVSPEGRERVRSASMRQVPLRSKPAKDIEEAVEQGPLAPGSFLLLETFGSFLEQLRAPGDPIQILELRVVALFGQDGSAVGARRRFEVNADDEGWLVRPSSLSTEQLGGRRDQAELRNWLHAYQDEVLARTSPRQGA